MAFFFLDYAIDARGAIAQVGRLGFDKVVGQRCTFEHRISDRVVGRNGDALLAQKYVSWGVPERP